jgi:hypothetical protein
MRPHTLHARMGLPRVSTGARMLRPLGLYPRRRTRDRLLSTLGVHTRRRPGRWGRVQNRGRNSLGIPLIALWLGRIHSICLRGLRGRPLIRVHLIRILGKTIRTNRGTLKIARAFLPEGGSTSPIVGETGDSRNKKRREYC